MKNSRLPGSVPDIGTDMVHYLLSLFSRRFEQVPGAPFGFVNPNFNEAGSGKVAMFVAHVMRFAKTCRKLLAVLPKFREHVQRIHILRVIVEHTLHASDGANGFQRGAANL